jgi:hypothetical protein
MSLFIFSVSSHWWRLQWVHTFHKCHCFHFFTLYCKTPKNIVILSPRTVCLRPLASIRVLVSDKELFCWAVRFLNEKWAWIKWVSWREERVCLSAMVTFHIPTDLCFLSISWLIGLTWPTWAEDTKSVIANLIVLQISHCRQLYIYIVILLRSV